MQINRGVAMVYRVLAGFIPMVLGWMIWSGAIPVRQWMFGGSTAAPERVARQGAGGHQESKEPGRPGMPEIARVIRERDDMLSQAVEAERMMREMERLAENSQATRSASQGRNPSSNRPGWAPSGGWNAR